MGACPTAAELAAAREAHEGEVFDLDGPYTVSNSYSLTNGANGFAEIGLAADTKPLIAPTEVADAQTGNVAALTAYNNARGIVLDDGSSKNYTLGRQRRRRCRGSPRPTRVRVGAAATFTGPVVLDYRNSAWKLQPDRAGHRPRRRTPSTFDQTRTGNAAPANVGGDLKLGTFNVLNYFTDHRPGLRRLAAAAPAATSTTGRQPGHQSTPAPAATARAARCATPDDLLPPAGQDRHRDQHARRRRRRRSRRSRTPSSSASRPRRRRLDAGRPPSTPPPGQHAAGPSCRRRPRLTCRLAEQDVIRTAFIYNPSTVAPVGRLARSSSATPPSATPASRWPRPSRPRARGRRDAFGVIVNHFKSKGSGARRRHRAGQRQPGPRRRRRPALADFADAVQDRRAASPRCS